MDELSDYFLSDTSLAEHKNFGFRPRGRLNISSELDQSRALAE